jgi:hypothetical protein
MTLFEAVRSIVLQKQVLDGPFELTETAARNRCAPILVRYEGSFWALRIDHGQHLPLLAELKKELSPRRLPDYLIFAEPGARSPGDRELLVLVCEMKSSDEGARDAVRQVQLGAFVAHYLARIAQYNMGPKARDPGLFICGVIANAGLPAHAQPYRRGKGGRLDYEQMPNVNGDVPIFQVPGGGEIHLEAFF